MKEGFYRQTARVERDHWWFCYRRLLATTVLDRSGFRGRPEMRALDVGCGTGGNLETIRSLGPFTVGLDRSSLALSMASAAEHPSSLVCADANRLGELFSEGSFDLITFFNVLYHRWIVDDRDVIRQAGELLRPGGRLLLTEPAFRSLRRAHDRIDFGARRYSESELREAVEHGGLTVTQSTYFNATALFPVMLAAGLDRLRSRRSTDEDGDETVELAMPAEPVRSLLRVLCGAELSLIRRFGRVPFGVTLLIVAQRPASSGAQVGM